LWHAPQGVDLPKKRVFELSVKAIKPLLRQTGPFWEESTSASYNLSAAFSLSDSVYVANAALFLASDEANFGVALPGDGGALVHIN
jgi:hypothetical protein